MTTGLSATTRRPALAAATTGGGAMTPPHPASRWQGPAAGDATAYHLHAVIATRRRPRRASLMFGAVTVAPPCVARDGRSRHARVMVEAAGLKWRGRGDDEARRGQHRRGGHGCAIRGEPWSKWPAARCGERHLNCTLRYGRPQRWRRDRPALLRRRARRPGAAASPGDNPVHRAALLF
jgi:hypothetical protein